MLKSGKTRIGAFRRADRGLAAVEFALILPVMIALLFGMAELSRAVFCRTAISQIASTVADLIAQENSVDADDFQNVYNAANIILYPYYPDVSTQKPSIRITSVIYDAKKSGGTSGTVEWTCKQPGSGTLSPATLSPGDNVSFGKQLLSSGGSVLMVEVAYNYNPPTTRELVGGLQFSDKFYTKPRRVALIPAPESCT
jgi:Flp pilus assembly protein TadG